MIYHGTQKLGSVIYLVTLKLSNMIYPVTLKLGSVIYSVTLKLGNVIYHDTQDLSLCAEFPMTVKQIICREDAKISRGGLVPKIGRGEWTFHFKGVFKHGIQAKQMGILMFVDSKNYWLIADV